LDSKLIYEAHRMGIEIFDGMAESQVLDKIEESKEKEKAGMFSGIIEGFKKGEIPPIDEERVQSVTLQKPKKTREEKFDSLLPPRYRKLLPPQKPTATFSIFWGTVGTGKTCEALTQARAAYVGKRVDTWKWETEMSLLLSLKAGFTDGSFNDRFQRLREVDFLIIDEYGKSPQSDYDKAIIFDILNYRYMWEKRSILISNGNNVEQLKQIIDPATRDRFKGNTHEFKGESKR